MNPLVAIVAALLLVVFWRFVLLGLVVFLAACTLIGLVHMFGAIARLASKPEKSPAPQGRARARLGDPTIITPLCLRPNCPFHQGEQP